MRPTAVRPAARCSRVAAMTMPLLNGLRKDQIRRASRRLDMTIRPAVTASSQAAPASRAGLSSSQGPGALPSGASATATTAARAAPMSSCSAVSVQVSKTQTRKAQQKVAPALACHEFLTFIRRRPSLIGPLAPHPSGRWPCIYRLPALCPCPRPGRAPPCPGLQVRAEYLGECRAERGQVLRAPARDQHAGALLADDDLLIYPGGAGVPEVGPQARP